MSNKKKRQNRPNRQQEVVQQKTKSPAQLKKEQKAEAARLAQERHKQRQMRYGLAVVLAFIAVVISFSSGKFAGQSIYGWLQVLCYVLMAACGLLMMGASRFEEPEAKQKRMHMIGIAFLMVAIGAGLSQVVMILRG